MVYSIAMRLYDNAAVKDLMDDFDMRISAGARHRFPRMSNVRQNWMVPITSPSYRRGTAILWCPILEDTGQTCTAVPELHGV